MNNDLQSETNAKLPSQKKEWQKPNVVVLDKNIVQTGLLTGQNESTHTVGTSSGTS